MGGEDAFVWYLKFTALVLIFNFDFHVDIIYQYWVIRKLTHWPIKKPIYKTYSF